MKEEFKSAGGGLLCPFCKSGDLLVTYENVNITNYLEDISSDGSFLTADIEDVNYGYASGPYMSCSEDCRIITLDDILDKFYPFEESKD